MSVAYKDVPRTSRKFSFLEMLGDLVDDFAKARDASWEMQRLSRLSDEQLKREGVERGDIARHVYNRYYGL